MDARIPLPNTTLLDSSYRIERVIGAGGFGLTYAAEDILLSTRVAVKEYYPEEFGHRDAKMRVGPKSLRDKDPFAWGRSSFLQEARTLARFQHPSIVQVSRVFEANNTAYMVTDFEDGEDFEKWLSKLGRAPTQAELDRITYPLLDALETIHAAHFLHRDIAPDNIIIRRDGPPVLLDFGAARRASAEESRCLTGVVKAGYSPFEQYAKDTRLQGPWSDIYAFGAMLYRAVSGHPPDEATLRMANNRMQPAAAFAQRGYRPAFLAGIDACLRVTHADRPQSVSDLRRLLIPASTRAMSVAPSPVARTRSATLTRMISAREISTAANGLLHRVKRVVSDLEKLAKKSVARAKEHTLVLLIVGSISVMAVGALAAPVLVNALAVVDPKGQQEGRRELQDELERERHRREQAERDREEALTRGQHESERRRQAEQQRQAALQRAEQETRRREQAEREWEQTLKREREQQRAAAFARWQNSPDANLKWFIQNSTSRRLRVRFASQDRERWFWPNYDKTYILLPGERLHYDLNGKMGEKVCYGAFWEDGSKFWGVGKSGAESCNSCCGTFGAGSMTSNLIE